MFMIIPGTLLGIGLLFLGLAVWKGSEGWWVASGVFGFFLLMAFIVCPVQYLSSRNEAWKAEQYYENLVLPNVVEETDSYVVVDNIEAGVWQSGEFNLYSYNSYVRVTRHWQDVPIISSIVYPVPEQLKYVKVK